MLALHRRVPGEPPLPLLPQPFPFSSLFLFTTSWGAPVIKRGAAPKRPKVSKIFSRPTPTPPASSPSDERRPFPIQDERRRGKVRRRGQAGGLRADHNPGPRSGEVACRCRWKKLPVQEWDVWNERMHPKCIQMHFNDGSAQQRCSKLISDANG